MKKFLFAPALAALAMFFFGFLYWGISPLPYRALSRVPDDAAAGEALRKIFPASGAYFIPGTYLDSAKHAELSVRGPIAEVHYLDHGMAAAPEVGMMVKGYLHEFAICLLLSLMIARLAPAFHRWTSRLRFCAMFGLLIGLYEFGYAVWWNHATAWVLMQSIYDFLAFVVVGLVLGKMLTPKAAADAAAADI